jgi:ABC-type antimicrobial peptide transport system permease subunit
MRWDGKMKILRLSLFNLRKNKKEAVVIAFLALVTTMLLAMVVINSSKIDKTFDDSLREIGVENGIVAIEKDVYRNEFSKILEEEFGASDIKEINYIFSDATDALDRDGESISYNLHFITAENDKKIEQFKKIESMAEADIANVSHPIWMPGLFKYSYGYSVGDTFTITKNGTEYPFEIVGFYQTGIGNNDGYGFKCIVSVEDFDLLSLLYSDKCYVAISFDRGDDFATADFIKRCEEVSSEDLSSNYIDFSIDQERQGETLYLELFLMLIIGLSVITLIAVLFVIRHKISNDIEDQMQQIGVLEALGYRSKEISLSYLYEYVISGGIGAILGGISACLTTPLINSGIAVMMGRTAKGGPGIVKAVIVTFIMIGVITLFALLKTRSVKKYPPVIAFRRGIKTHHFGRNILPLENTKGNINRRLAFKSILTDFKTNIGIMVCMILAGIAVLFSAATLAFFKNGSDGLVSMMGIDTDAVIVGTMDGVDVNAMKEEIASLPEVDNAIVSYGYPKITIKDQEPATFIVFNDYNDSQDIHPYKGRFPEHDNEIMISVSRSESEGLSIGDSMKLVHNGIEKSYTITGIVSSFMNSGTSCYITSEGYERIVPEARPNAVAVYLKDNVTLEEFEDKMYSIYGKSAKDSMGGESEADELEERIRAAADEKISILMSQYGVTSVDYAIRIGDQLITGNSRNYKIKDIQSFQGMIKNQMTSIAQAVKMVSIVTAILVSIIVAVILANLASSNVKRRRQELGIMKGMGYSSKDLMKQLAIKFMPACIISMIIAVFCSIGVDKLFWGTIFGTVADTNIAAIIIAAVIMTLFCYAVTYISAGKIKKISVTELMTE